MEGIITCLSDHVGQTLRIKCLDNIIDNNSFTISEQRCLHFTHRKKYISFNNILKFYFDLAFPKKTVTHKKSKNTWITNDLQVERNQLVILRKQANKSKYRATDQK